MHRIFDRKLVSVNDDHAAAAYVGQVECDPAGTLWAVLYFRDQTIEREQVRSLRHGKRRVTNMVLAAADTFPLDPRPSSQVPMNRLLVERRPSLRGRRGAVSHLPAPVGTMAI